MPSPTELRGLPTGMCFGSGGAISSAAVGPPTAAELMAPPLAFPGGVPRARCPGKVTNNRLLAYERAANPEVGAGGE